MLSRFYSSTDFVRGYFNSHNWIYIYILLHLHTTHIYLTFLPVTADLFWVGIQLNPEVLSRKLLSRAFQILIVIQHLSYFSQLFVIWRFYKHTFLFLSKSLIKLLDRTRLRMVAYVITPGKPSFNHLNVLSSDSDNIWFFSHLPYIFFKL